MYNDELMHAATRIMANRAEQLGISEDELMHYGRKGMKWGENIFAQDPRANQAAQALNRAKFDLQIKNKKQADLENKKNDFLLKAKKEQLLRNAKSGNGNSAEHPQGGQNWATKDEVNKRHSELESKKNELLSKAHAERDARNVAEQNKNSEPKFNGMTTREHLKNLTDNLENAFPGGFDEYVNQSLTTSVNIDNAYGNKNDADALKNEFRQSFADSINGYLQENNIPESETPKFQALYDSYTGRYDDAVDAALGINAYDKIFGNRKNKYR